MYKTLSDYNFGNTCIVQLKTLYMIVTNLVFHTHIHAHTEDRGNCYRHRFMGVKHCHTYANDCYTKCVCTCFCVYKLCHLCGHVLLYMAYRFHKDI